MTIFYGEEISEPIRLHLKFLPLQNFTVEWVNFNCLGKSQKYEIHDGEQQSLQYDQNQHKKYVD